MLWISEGIKTQKQSEFLNCFGTFLGKLNHQWESADKKTSAATSNHILVLLDMFLHILQYLLIYTQTSQRPTACQRGIEFFQVMWLCQYSHQQFCLIRSLLCWIYSSSWVICNTRLFSFMPLSFSYFNFARPIQHTGNIYRIFQVNLAHFQVGTALAWAAVGVFGRWKTRKENLGSEGGFNPAGMRWSGKRIRKTHTSWCEMVYSFTEASVLPLRCFACTVISKQMSTNKYGSRFWMLMWKKRFICNTAKTWVVLGWILISTICKLFFFFLAWTNWKTFKSPSLPELPGI